jgi:hypothetical protein
MYDKLVGVARGVVQPERGETMCCLLNLSQAPRTLKAGKMIAYLEPLEMNEFNTNALDRARQRSQVVKNVGPTQQSKQVSKEAQLPTAQKRKIIEEKGLSFKECRRTRTSHFI